MNNIKAVLFDMDGVLVDSEEFICLAAIKMFEKYGVIATPADFEPFIGAGEDRYLGGVAQKHGADLDIIQCKKETYDIYLEMIKGRLESLPGVESFFEECRSSGLKIVVATSADYVKMKANLEEIGFALDDFDAVINGLDVERKKPFPDIYLKAAQAVDTKIENCLVVEDAVNGVEAAKAAGAKCLALTTSFQASDLQGADWIIKDLSHIQEVRDKMFE